MSKGARILVIDDEKSIRKLLEISLSAEGYEVIPAKTGKRNTPAGSQTMSPMNIAARKTCIPIP